MPENETTSNLSEERKNKLRKLLNSKIYTPAKPADVAIIMDVPQSEISDFEDAVNKIVSEGYAVITKKGKLISIEKIGMVRGVFTGNSRGFGFVNVDGYDEDFFIPLGSINGAMHRDTVLIRPQNESSRGTKREAEVISVVKRGFERIIGTYDEQSGGFGFVRPDDKKLGKDIFIAVGNSRNAITGHKVIVKLTKASEGGRNPEGIVTEILGHMNDPGIDILSIILSYGLPIEFSKKVMHETEMLPNEPQTSDFDGREDFRGGTVITIDGEDAKDLDDAVSLILLDNGNYQLSVHIADVCHYVGEAAETDKEAYKRGTSVYLADRVIPMLPHKLSNGICSLNHGVQRLTLSCVMEIDKNGKVVDSRITEGVIASKHRMTYTIVNDILTDTNSSYRAEYADIVPMLEKMNELKDILRGKRHKRGSIEFGLTESKIIVDENGKPLDIVLRERNDAANLIEEFMLVCNETVAEKYCRAGLPFVYRTHEEPDGEKLQKLAPLLRSLGYRIKSAGLYPKAMQELLSSLEGKPEEAIISRLILRSLKQARYTVSCDGHYGLAAKYYCHFTSPIRRYPDLQIHRIIKKSLKNSLNESETARLNCALPETARRCSITERTAEETEKEVENLKKVEFMADKLGEIFTGVISGVTSWGLYVELPNTVEGLIPLSELDDDYYIYDETGYRYFGKHTGKSYCLGDKVDIIVAKANTADRKLDFAFAD